MTEIKKNVEINNISSNNNDFKVVKNNIDNTLDKKMSSNLQPTSPSIKASNIGLDLLANPQKQKIDIKSIDNNNTKVESSGNYVNEALKESIIDQEDLEEKHNNTVNNNINYDKLSFVSTISSKKDSKKIHHFDLNSDNSSLSKTFNSIPGSEFPNIINDENIKIQLDKPESVNSLYNRLEQMSSNSSINSNKIVSTPPPPKKTVSEIKMEKEDILYQFAKMRRLGINVSNKFNMTSDLDEMKVELTKLKKDREIENSIKFSRKALMAITTGIEFLNNKFDPCDLRLDGWSESIHENLTEYDEIFEELHEKYKGSSKISPEIKLMLMVGGSAFMFHLTNTMFKSALPGMGDIMKNNPDLMKQFASVALNQMNDNVKNNNFNNNQDTQKEMSGPVGMDDLLNNNNDNASISSSQFERKMMDTKLPKQFNLNLNA